MLNNFDNATLICALQIDNTNMNTNTMCVTQIIIRMINIVRINYIQMRQARYQVKMNQEDIMKRIFI